MNDLAKKLVAFHLGSVNTQNLIPSDLEHIRLDTFVENQLNSLEESKQLRIVGYVDNAAPAQVVVWNNQPVATRTSILGSCIEVYLALIQKYGLTGSARDIRRKILHDYKREIFGKQYMNKITELYECTGLQMII